MKEDKLEETIKGLEELSAFLFREYGKIKPDESKPYYDRFLFVHKALKLLKEQKGKIEDAYHQGYSDGYDAKAMEIEEDII